MTLPVKYLESHSRKGYILELLILNMPNFVTVREESTETGSLVQ